MAQCECSAQPSSMSSHLFALPPLLWKQVECCRILTNPIPPVFAYYTKLAVRDRPDPGTMWHFAAIECSTMALVTFLHASNRGVVWFRCYESRMGQSDCSYLSRFYLALTIALIITALLRSSLIALLILPVHKWNSVEKWKWIGRVLTVCPFGFYTDLATGLYRTWMRRFLRH